MISALIYILVLCLVFGIILYVVRMLPLPEPFGVIAQAIVALILLLIILDMLLGGRFLGLPPGRLP